MRPSRSSAGFRCSAISSGGPGVVEGKAGSKFSIGFRGGERVTSKEQSAVVERGIPILGIIMRSGIRGGIGIE